MGNPVELEKGPQEARGSFHLNESVAPLFGLNKIPCPIPPSHLDQGRRERADYVRLYWQEGGEELERKIEVKNQWEKLLKRKRFSLTLTPKQIQKVTGGDPEIIRSFIIDFGLGRKVKEMKFEFDSQGFLQLLITIFAYKKARQTKPEDIRLNPNLIILSGVEKIPFTFTIPETKRKKEIFKRVRDNWQSGGLSFQRAEETSNPLRVFLTGIDWKKETTPLTLSQIRTGIGEKYRDLKLLRSTLQIGTKNERESLPQKTVYDFTKIELLQLIVASFAIREKPMIASEGG